MQYYWLKNESCSILVTVKSHTFWMFRFLFIAWSAVMKFKLQSYLIVYNGKNKKNLLYRYRYDYFVEISNFFCVTKLMLWYFFQYNCIIAVIFIVQVVVPPFWGHLHLLLFVCPFVHPSVLKVCDMCLAIIFSPIMIKLYTNIH